MKRDQDAFETTELQRLSALAAQVFAVLAVVSAVVGSTTGAGLWGAAAAIGFLISGAPMPRLQRVPVRAVSRRR